MKKYTEKDIESMLSKTEKTLPKFDKNVVLPTTQIVNRRKRIIPILIAATLASAVVFSSFIMLLSEEEITLSQPDVSVSGDFSDISFSDQQSTVQGESSYDFSEESDEERSTAAVSSEPESEFVSEEYIQVVYPTANDFYVGQGLQSNLTIDEYFARNPLKHLNVRDTLSVYSREAKKLEQRIELIDGFSKAIDVVLNFEADLYEITGDCRGVSENGTFTFNVGMYGDWYFAVNDDNYRLVALGADKNDFALSAKKYIDMHKTVFGEGDYYYTVEERDSEYIVFVSDRSEPDSVIKRMPEFTFSYRMIYYGVYSLKYILHSENGVSLGDFETATCDDALESLFNDEFYASHGFTFGETDEYAMLGYDVRYLKTNYEALVCPFYAFVIKLNPNSDDGEIRTLFVPAISKIHLIDNTEFE